MLGGGGRPGGVLGTPRELPPLFLPREDGRSSHLIPQERPSLVPCTPASSHQDCETGWPRRRMGGSEPCPTHDFCSGLRGSPEPTRYFLTKSEVRCACGRHRGSRLRVTLQGGGGNEPRSCGRLAEPGGASLGGGSRARPRGDRRTSQNLPEPQNQPQSRNQNWPRPVNHTGLGPCAG